MKKTDIQSLVAAASLVCALPAPAENVTLIDFPSVASELRIAAGLHTNAADRAGQKVVKPDGVHFTFDHAKLNESCHWSTISVPASLNKGIEWFERDVNLVLRSTPFRRITRMMAINFTDSEGEVFQFYPYRVEEDFVAKELVFSYHVIRGNHGKPWGAKGNGRMDPPLRLSSVNGHFDAQIGISEMVLLRMEKMPGDDAAQRTVRFREPISIDTTYPGARPFRHAETVVCRVSPAFRGTAKLTLWANSTASANQGEMKRFKCTAKESTETLSFNLDLRPSDTVGFRSVTFYPATGTAKSGYRVVSAEAGYLTSEAETLRFGVETGNRLNIARTERPEERPTLVFRNPTDSTRRYSAAVTLVDAFGRMIDIPFERELNAGEIQRVAVPWPLPAKGWWIANCKAKGADGSVAKSTQRFAWIDLHEVTPFLEKPKFRFGIHYHGTAYLPDLVDPTIAALVAAGAKFTRTDYSFMFGDIMPQEGVEKWARADDLLSRLRRAGLSLEIIVSGTPKWAVDPAVLEERKGERRTGCFPSRSGLFKDFCRKFAARYGREIDYYEVGNEWDITTRKTLHRDEALRMQREAFEGIHESCPTAAVIPNGWAYLSSKGLHPDNHNIGLFEYFAEHPEFYDAWSIHGHGSFPNFVTRLQNEFLPLRAKTPLNARPWIAGETAYNSFGGEEIAVARTVWAKILYAWAWGARDYIWYNLRATGWLEGREPSYGLITADLQPRAGYAAFAALTTIFQGLDLDRRLVSRGDVHLLSFKGKSAAVDGIAVAGWKWGAKDPVTVTLMTDAKRAEFSDFMGNRTPAVITGGKVEFPLDENPKALILGDATFVAKQ